MAPNYEAVNTAVKQYVAEVKRVMPIDKAVLYGSYAKGNASEWSDVDICFFSNDFKGKRDVDIIIDLLGMAGKYHPAVCFEPNVFPTSELNSDNPFVKEVLRTGREII